MSIHKDWVLIELGGSSSQTITFDVHHNFSFHPGVVHTEKHVALACPGLIKKSMVYYATNLGWPDVADPKIELSLPHIYIVENDVVAASLGESVLRSKESSLMDLYYISLGTGVGSGHVLDGLAYDLDLGHMNIGGNNYCEGCRSIGCLNSELESRRLPKVLSDTHLDYVAQTLSKAIELKKIDMDTLLVLGGGIIRRYPNIASKLDHLIPNSVDVTITPSESKSSAFAGLHYLVNQR